jgi:hypothetical protein
VHSSSIITQINARFPSYEKNDDGFCDANIGKKHSHTKTKEFSINFSDESIEIFQSSLKELRFNIHGHII